MNKFNKEFLLGSATAAHQVEGNNTNSDSWAIEHFKDSTYVEPSLDAVDHYNRYEEDINLLSEAGLNTYRFSIEWARIEPVEGVFDEKETNHYKEMIRFCHEKGIEPMITLHHFTSPKWLISKGGWESEDTVESFRKYTKYIMEQLGSEIKYVFTINEANMGIQVAAIAKRYMLQMMNDKGISKDEQDSIQMGINIKKILNGSEDAVKERMETFGTGQLETFTSPRTEAGNRIVMKAHVAAREIIREICPHVQVGLTLSLHDIQVVSGGELHAEKEWEDEFTQYLPYIEEDDLLGIQNYTRSIIGSTGLQDAEGRERTQMGYEYYPEALENVIRRVSRSYRKDIIITENGIATDDDEKRIAFINTALKGVKNCIEDGIPVKGYMYWSLLDNFEWQKGYSMTFGLIGVDRMTQKRFPKRSLSYLGTWI